jgi:hypothetical protein
MHPRGAVFDALLERHGAVPACGVPWLDSVATEAAVVRLSRGAGLTAPLPDLLGLAVRVPGDGAPVDLLLSSTGRGRLTRFLPPLADAVSRDGLRFSLAVACGPGPWQPFATLTLTAPVPALDPDVRFDAVQNPPPGLVPDGPMARFRAPAYARARAARTATRGR